MSRIFKSCLVQLLALFFLAFQVPCLPAQELATHDDEFIRDLYQRRLYDVLEWHCQAEFDKAETLQGRKSELAAILIKVGTVQASQGPLNQSVGKFQKLKSDALRFEKATASYPRSLFVKLQAAQIGIDEARVLGVLAEQSTNDQKDKFKKQAQEALALSIQRLKSLSSSIIQRKSTAPTKLNLNDPHGKLSKNELSALENVLTFQRLRALEVQYDLFSASDVAARKSTAIDTVRECQTLLTGTAPSSELWWKTKRMMLTANARLKDWSKWESVWSSLAVADAPEQVFGELVAARVDGLLDQKQFSQAETDYTRLVIIGGNLFPEAAAESMNARQLEFCSAWPALDVVRCRLGIELALANNQSSGIQNQVMDFSRLLRRRHGRYWSSRLLGKLVDAGGTYGNMIPLLVIRQKIEGRDAEGVRRLAIPTFQNLMKAKDGKSALQLASLIAGGVRSMPAEKWMMDLISDAASTFPKQPDAAPVHSYAAGIAEFLFDKKKISFDEFLAICKRQLVHWPASRTTDAIRVPLSGRLIRMGRRKDAMDILTTVNLKSDRLEQAASFSQLAWDREVLGRPADDAKLKKWREDAGKRSESWKKMLEQEEGRWVGRWSLGAKRFALLAVDASLLSGRRVHSWNEDALDRVENRLPEMDLELDSRFRVVETFHHFRKTKGVFEHPVVLDKDILSGDLVYLINRLLMYVPEIGLKGKDVRANERARGIAACKVIARCVELLPEEWTQPSHRSSRWLLGLKGRCFLVAGNPKKAQKASNELVKLSAKSLFAWRLVGLSYSASNDPEDAAKAETTWRKISVLTKPNSESWFEAKYYLAAALRGKGETKKAKSVLAYLKLTNRKAWDASVYKKQLERLLKDIESDSLPLP